MLIEFGVKNFRSIRNECILSMEAYTRDRTEKEIIRTEGNVSALPIASIFGPNASGKSTLLKALGLMQDAVLNSGNIPTNSKMKDQRFAFDDNNDPTVISAEFINNRRYRYTISILNGVFSEEELVCEGEPVFSRRDDTAEFGKSIGRKEREKLEFVWSLTNPNSLFLSKCAQSKIDITQEAYEWIAEKITFVEKMRINEHELSKAVSEYKSEMIDMLSVADFGISDIIAEDYNADELPKGIRRFMKEDGLKFRKYYMSHNISEGSDSRTYRLDMDLESDGTWALTGMAPEWLSAMKSGNLIVVDELEKSLHPLIVDYLLSLISDPESNPKGAQLIFTAHDALIPKRNHFRRDQIWFAARDPNVGMTALYSLLDYDVRSDLEFTNNYLEGRFGAIPRIRKNRG